MINDLIECDAEKFDGVAVNNEAYGSIKCSSNIAKRKKYLDNLKKTVEEARKQKNGKLLTHYSMAWHWDCNELRLKWNGKDASANIHMIDIFDSFDIQVCIYNSTRVGYIYIYIYYYRFLSSIDGLTLLV